MSNPFKLSSIDVAASNGHAVSRVSGGPILGYVRAGIRGGKQVYLWSETNASARDVAAWRDIGATADFPSIAHALHAFLDPAPPAAPVASDPVPADVPCYLAIAYKDGTETVLGVFRVAEHGSAAEAEREAGKLCDRIRAAAPLASYGTRWKNGKPSETDAAFAALDAAEAALAAEPVTKPVRSAAWARAFDVREAAVKRAVSLDPVRFVRAYPSRAMAYRWLLPADMVARIEAAEDDAAMRAAVGAPAMVPQPCRPQQGQAAGPELPPGYSLEEDSDGDWVLIPPAGVTIFSAPGEPLLIGACDRATALSDAIEHLQGIDVSGN